MDYGSDIFSSVLDNSATGAAAESQGGILDYFGSDKFKNLGAGLEGIGSLGSIGTSIYGLFQTNKALKLQKQALSEAQKQNAIENERYDKREAER
ncbi:MAG: hypothetical protein J1D99_06835, partial [Campylobacter sp.]|nr:hypothetical protein [Campylobacter sp.]